MKEYKIKETSSEKLQIVKWYESGVWMNKNELMLRKITKTTHQEVLQKERRKQLPILIVIDGVDGVGKTSIVKNITQQIENDYQEKCIFNTFKRRREDKETFKEAKIETEYMFRREVVEQINRRIVEYPENANYVIIVYN